MIAEPASVTKQLGRLHCLRAIAALGVFYHHLGQFGSATFDSSTGLPASGLLWTGVDLFFVLSGFLMMWTTDGKTGGFRVGLSFFITRAARVYPMYWITLAATYGFALWLPAALSNDQQCSVPCQITLIPEQGGFLIGPAWTLSFEMVFYLVFAILLVLSPQGRIRALAVWTIIAAALGTFITTQITVVHHVYTPLVLEFLAGVWIAVLIKRGVRLNGWPGLVAAGVLLLGGAALFNALSPSLPSGVAEWVRVALCGFPASVIIWCLASRDATKPHYPSPIMAKLGNDSYAIYLAHWPIVAVVSTVANTWAMPTFLSFVIYLAVTVVSTLLLSRALTNYIGSPAQEFAKSLTALIKRQRG
ncbi:hypothetical protein ABAC460_17735 [Asticcacaulis sp. AC460]|uniref:acyltransferase family protein n=1 Tax=Asticcacaulis sp. AC460 TaxID=1282360 RepID=UPI0003C3E380|nr:acyltransferase [Asticcacaulis sp. AC460]ESQ88034.1 hypothetical protein ABAC460_17735 [Asticcacaulis sp. AC460]